MIKSFLKMAIPRKVRPFLRQLQMKIFGLERDYWDKSNSEIFDKIYRDRTWGKKHGGLPTSGSGSHDGAIIDPYISVVREFLYQVRPNVIVDLGCGDFNVGQHFVDEVGQYIACDVSTVILAQNVEEYAFIDNVEFRHLDLATDELPMAEVAFVRQVLQHLSNEDIQAFVDKLNNQRPYKFLIVTEHLPANDSFIPNVDKPTGPNVRVGANSGVVLHEAPFNLKCREQSVILELPENVGVTKAAIRSTLYEFGE